VNDYVISPSQRTLWAEGHSVAGWGMSSCRLRGPKSVRLGNGRWDGVPL